MLNKGAKPNLKDEDEVEGNKKSFSIPRSQPIPIPENKDSDRFSWDEPTEKDTYLFFSAQGVSPRGVSHQEFPVGSPPKYKLKLSGNLD